MLSHLDGWREGTVGRLRLDCDAPTGVLAKVRPPIRSREDVEFRSQALLACQLDWVGSEPACCAREMKVAEVLAWYPAARFGLRKGDIASATTPTSRAGSRAALHGAGGRVVATRPSRGWI